MSILRMNEETYRAVHEHLFSEGGENFAFLLCKTTEFRKDPIFVAVRALLVPNSEISVDGNGNGVSTEGVLKAINEAVRGGYSLIEVHNHFGTNPRFSLTDKIGLREIVPYMLESLPNRPYGATVWTKSCVYGESFTQQGRSSPMKSVTVCTTGFKQLASRELGSPFYSDQYSRQTPWFSESGQRLIGSLKVGVVGAGGTGSQVIQQLAYLGVRHIVIVDDDIAELSNLNRLVTAKINDVGQAKAALAKRLVQSVAPDASVEVVLKRLQSKNALEVLKSVDVLFGCVDNDGARFILNQFSKVYHIPLFDIGTGIEMENGQVKAVGGRLCVVLPGGPCMICMNQIDIEEAKYFLSSTKERKVAAERGYIRGADVKAPSVAPLNGALASESVLEFCMYLSGTRRVNYCTVYDALGVGQKNSGQWSTPMLVVPSKSCFVCNNIAGSADDSIFARYLSEGEY